MAAVKALSQKPVRLLVNTHVHGDHTGGNENIGKLGINILAQDNVRVRLLKGVNGAAPAAPVALPLVTYTDKVQLHLDGEDVQIGKFPPAHTDGDSYIRFPKIDVIHVGDVFRTVGYPTVDGANGGTVKGTIEALQMIVDMAGPNTKILPGHGVVVSRDAGRVVPGGHDRGAEARDGRDQAGHDARAGHRRESTRGSRAEVRHDRPAARRGRHRAHAHAVLQRAQVRALRRTTGASTTNSA